MPFMRRRPVLRAAAVGGAYLAVKRSADRRADQLARDSTQDQRLSDLEQRRASSQRTRAAPAVPAQASPSITDQLNQLADLRDQGVLSDDEFAAAKSTLLGE
jgi:hypothetical protein